MDHSTTTACLCGAFLATGCTHDVRETVDVVESASGTTSSPTVEPGTSAPSETTVNTNAADSTTASAASSGGQSSDTTGGVIYDVGAGTTGRLDDGCQGVDLLFVIDNSGSMGPYQTNLGASVPGFIEAMRDSVPTDDYHVMIVDSTGAAGEGKCAGVLGAGNRGTSSGAQCIVADQPNYLAGDAEIDALFPCLALTGIQGSSAEMVTGAMLNAVSPGFVADGGCNEGFLRDDAILVVVVITDEFAGYGGGGWANVLKSYKQEDGIVVLGLIGDNPADGDPFKYPASADMTPWGTLPDCAPWEYFSYPNEASPNPGLVEFADAFDGNGFLGSICAADYSDALLSAVDAITLTCVDFVPEG